jgi:hypothetical protein
MPPPPLAPLAAQRLYAWPATDPEATRTDDRVSGPAGLPELALVACALHWSCMCGREPLPCARELLPRPAGSDEGDTDPPPPPHSPLLSVMLTSLPGAQAPK